LPFHLGRSSVFSVSDIFIYSRSPVHGAAIMEQLQAGDGETAKFIGVPLELMAAQPPGPLNAQAAAIMKPLVEKAAVVQSINEAWALVAILTIAALAFVPFARKVATGGPVRVWDTL
jgi:DHA2 family multidrug resistance protein